ncbi:membrane protein [Candidatus Methylomirabilis lanthanidiphila]|uniref:Membrane protein n=1 Tax=Candidatus Methylomirabilis lanthanidiphila TaxID=2211376 RepID=A0A564ZH17_9BACT|nr:metal ABC transporter permease [Candidatus Methylomirabilis lanthanidiphila]VUZ84641.1 membrane protein [Candidatus Methylomirabilis lanthanidiphila]
MIQEFISSWPLFQNTYLVGWSIALLLSLVGVLAVARDQIFIGAAMSQASTLGIALAMWIGAWIAPATLPWFHSDEFLSAMAVAFSLGAALITGGWAATDRESHEAITGWVFLGSASLSILIVSHSPHGLEEIHRLLASSIIGATRTDVWGFSALAGLTALFLAVTHRRTLLFLMDPAMAAAVGMHTGGWAAIISALLGLAIGLSIRSSGMLYTFGCLVLPALIAKNVCREVGPMFLVAPLVAVLTGAIAFVLANHYDYPPAQMTVALLSLALTIAWLFRRLRQANGMF